MRRCCATAGQLRTQHTFSRTSGLRGQPKGVQRGSACVSTPLHSACYGPGAPGQEPGWRQASQTPLIRSQMTRMVPRQDHQVMHTPARKNFSCTPGLRPLLLAHARSGLAQTAAFGPLRDTPRRGPTTLFALVVGEGGTAPPPYFAQRPTAGEVLATPRPARYSS
jgi:hypothetical protein